MELVDIPDDLVRQGQRVAEAHGLVLQDLLLRGLRSEIEQARHDVVYRWEPLVGGHAGAAFPTVPPHLIAYGADAGSPPGRKRTMR